MKRKPVPPADIDAYIAAFPADVRRVLQRIRATVRKAAPQADEAIKYEMPTFVLHGNLLHFAAFKKHIGFYPRVTAVAKFEKELSGYEGERGSVRFPLDRPIPYGLIGRIARFRAQENIRRRSVRRG